MATKSKQWSDRCSSYHSRQAYAGSYRPTPPLQGRLCRPLPRESTSTYGQECLSVLMRYVDPYMATKFNDVNSGQIVAVPTTVGKLQGSTDLHHHCRKDYAGPFHSRKRIHFHQLQWTRVSQSHRSRIVRNALEEPIMRRVLVLPHSHTSTLPHFQPQPQPQP